MPYATRQRTIEFPKRKSINNVTPKTGEKVFIKPTASSSARKAFHGSAPTEITCREKELQQLNNFLMTHLKDQSSGSIYMSGLPGTGKTASVHFIIQKYELNKKCHVVNINCASFKTSNAVFNRIGEDLKIKIKKKSEKEIVASIERYLLRKHKIILLILDEIDQLESKFQSVLYKIFEWASWENSKFILVGIANSMDLTDRNLPRLCAKVELKPMLLHFPPYTKDEICKILKTRLAEVSADKVFAPGAIELIAAKVAGTSGDIRRALDLGRRVIEMTEQKNQKLRDDFPINIECNEIESEKCLKRKMEDTPSKGISSELDSMADDIVGIFDPSPQKLLRSNKSERKCLGEITPKKFNLPANVCTESEIFQKSPLRKTRKLVESENSGQRLKKQDVNPKVLQKSPEKILREDFVLRRSPRKLQFNVDSKDVLSVVKNVFGQSKNFKPNEESSFPLHQKLVICTLLLLIKKGSKKDLTIGKLHQVYSKICAKHGLTAVDKSGFLFLIRQVEVTGVLQIGKGVGALAKITLLWDESEVVNSLKDLTLLSSILNDNAKKAKDRYPWSIISYGQVYTYLESDENKTRLESDRSLKDNS